MSDKITVVATIEADSKKVWDYYTEPQHITQWNFAIDTWHCPAASNDMRLGGKYSARMEAKDGSFGFDFEGIYSHIEQGRNFTYQFGDRECKVEFNNIGEQTELVVSFDPEHENDLELQRGGWQSILNNFKKYTEQN
jgi:uncharacterized protein YndB with AHSA1/START domain